MDLLDLQILFDDIAEKLKQQGNNPDEIEEILIEEASRVAKELRGQE